MLNGIQIHEKVKQNMKLFENEKRVFSAVTVLTASLAQMTSCDTRENWFAKEEEDATFIIPKVSAYNDNSSTQGL